jgi:signal transduction histidine kinase/DNA-binding response OmpR family regulator/streptogramin lyase
VYTSLLDHQGFVWFGTEEGLTRFDGHSFKVYPSDNTQEASIPHDIVKKLYEDSKGRIWVGTERGIAFLSNPDRRVVRISGDVANLRISGIEEMRNGAIWIVTPKGIYEVADNHDAAMLISQRKIGIRSKAVLLNIAQDKDGYLWAIDVDGRVFSSRKKEIAKLFRSKEYVAIGKMAKGNFVYFVSSKDVDFFDVRVKKVRSVRFGSRIVGAYPLSDDDLLIVMSNGEVVRYTISKSSYASLPLHLSNTYITGAVAPVAGTLALSTLESGVLMYAENHPLFEVVNPLNMAKGENQIFKSMVTLRDGRIAACAWNHGVVVLSGGLKVVRTFHVSDALDGFNAQSITEFVPGSLMVGTIGGGIRFVGEVKNQATYSAALRPLGNDNIWTLVSSQYGKGVWIGSQQNGLLLFNPQIGLLDKRFSMAFRNMDVRAIMEVDSDKVLVGLLNRGVYLLSLRSNRSYRIGSSDPRLGNAGVYCFHRDPNQPNFIWIGTYGSGLLRLNIASLKVDRAYTVKDGLPSNVVKSIQADFKGQLWLGTAKGLCKISPSTGMFTSFGTDGRLPQQIFSFGSSVRLGDGTIVFGTANGLVRFGPQQLRETQSLVFPIVYSIKADAKEVAANRQGASVGSLKIPYVDNTVSVEFGAIAYSAQQQPSFMYKLEGVDAKWKRSDNPQNDVTYSNLRSGRYTFRVKNASYGKEEGANETTVTFRIGYPFWGSPVMITLYVLIVATILFFYRRYAIYRRNAEAERIKNKYELDVAQQMYKMRLKFFANISHEFRTPLTLILGPIQALMEEKAMASERKLAMYHRISRNAKRMLNLVSQIADYRKLEEDQTVINVELLDVTSLAKQTVDLFLDQVEQKRQQLTFDAQVPVLEGWVDRDKFEKILVNLLSNAVKYSEAEDAIRVVLNKELVSEAEWLHLEVADSGIGIAKEHVDKVFDDFFRASSNEGGTGIGLAYTKRLVELHKGTISIASELGEGTTVTVRLPISAAAYSEKEKSSTSSYAHKERTSMLPFEKEIPEASTAASAKKWKILVVDDDAEICKYVAEIFEDHCEVMTASDGQVGLRKATSFLPSLIISDILMPKMNGLDLLKKLKENERTAHIPVMLLSARSDSSSIKQGLALGADAYLSKPFDEDQLKFNVLNLLNTQDRLLSSMSPVGANVDLELLSTVDRRFFKKVVAAVERNIDNYEYDIDDLCVDIGVSRTQLYRKMKLVAGVSANEFIRNYRLKKAAKLLGNPNMNVGDVLFAVGFNNRSYFNRCFKEYFGMTPMEYVERFCKGPSSPPQPLD